MAYSKSNNTKQEISSKNFESHAVGPGSDNAIGATDMYIPADAPNTQLNALIPSGEELGYSQYRYGFENATRNDVIYPSMDTSINHIFFNKHSRFYPPSCNSPFRSFNIS